MDAALSEAAKAGEDGEVPVGAVIVREGRAIARAANQVEKLRDATAHAEMLALTAAAAALENWRLEGCTLYVTMEPCAMCAGAILLARLDRVVYGADDPIAGACGSALDVANHPKLPRRVEVAGGIRGSECAALLKEFFKKRRGEKPPRRGGAETS